MTKYGGGGGGHAMDLASHPRGVAKLLVVSCTETCMGPRDLRKSILNVDFTHESLCTTSMIDLRNILISFGTVTRIIRVIAQPRGNMLLIGIGGSGRQSLSRLSAYIIGFKVFQIEVTKHYRKIEFREGE